MGTDLPKLHPVRFPQPKGKKGSVVYTLESKKGKPTKEIIAEMKRLSKQDIYPPTE